MVSIFSTAKICVGTCINVQSYGACEKVCDLREKCFLSLQMPRLSYFTADISTFHITHCISMTNTYTYSQSKKGNILEP